MSAKQASDAAVTPPMVIWAQRNEVVFLTICLEDCKNPDIKFEENSVYFNGIGGTEKKRHEVTIDLFKAIDPEKSQTFVRDRNIELVLKKKESGPYWPSLTKEKKKCHWLKIDFSKWNDENDSEDEIGGGLGGGQPDDLESMMRQMGGLGGMGGMGGGLEDKPSFGELDQESDSDDEGMPDLE